MDMENYKIGDWIWCKENDKIAQILEIQELWDYITFKLWFPETNEILYVNKDSIFDISEQKPISADKFIYTIASARIRDAMSQDIMLSPLQENLIPLPHQIYALNRAISSDKIRYLLADEVGLGKTIEAGLIMKELKLRGLVNRVLVVVPKGLVKQWKQEMYNHFNERFYVLIPQDFSVLKEFSDEVNIWKQFNQVICPLDSIKPIKERKGWDSERIRDYNRERYENIINAGWDLIIIDEAHRIAGSTSNVARHRLGQGLADSSPFLLLLSATPHQGKTDAFYRLMRLLDKDAFPQIGSIVKEQVRQYVIRTEKREAVDTEGNPLLKNRQTRLIGIKWQERHSEQRQLYDSVTEYVRLGYNQALLEKRSYIGFLMVLMQRMVSSSTHAIRKALFRRLEVLNQIYKGLSNEENLDSDFLGLDAQEQLEEVIKSTRIALRSEKEEVKFLLDIANKCKRQYTDAKTEELIDLIQRLQIEERDDKVKILIFTEFVATQDMLRKYLEEKGFFIALINGSMSIEERSESQKFFSKDAQIMISTDAGGEGLNLQFCYIVINYDLPWNPMKLEQRIGRVDRIGQEKDVKIYNFMIKDTVEYRVQEVIEEKLQIILDDFGVDKTQDLLDSVELELDFNEMYIGSILNPDKLEEKINITTSLIREKSEEISKSKDILKDEKTFDISLTSEIANNPISLWVEKMVIHYILDNGGDIEKKLYSYDIKWPNGSIQKDITFSNKELVHSELSYMGLENIKVKRIINELGNFVGKGIIPVIKLKKSFDGISGYWSLWKLKINDKGKNNERIFPIFFSDNKKILLPTSNRLWELLINREDFEITGYKNINLEDRKRIEEKTKGDAYNLFNEMLNFYNYRLDKEYEKGKLAFELRKETIQKIGLKTVRNYRLKALEKEKQQWENHIKNSREMNPRLSLLTLAYIKN